MTTKEIRKALKKAGVAIQSTTSSSRVRGWTNSASTGWDFRGEYPWATWYQRNGRRVKAIIPDRTQEVSLTFRVGFVGLNRRTVDKKYIKEQFELVRSTLTSIGVAYQETNEGFTLEVDNPYTEAEVERSREAYARACRA